MEFRFAPRDEIYAEQLVRTLGTITGDHEDFERVTINLTTMLESRAGSRTKEKFGRRFRAIDNALVQLRERRSSPFCLKLVWVNPGAVGQHFEIPLEYLLPKVMEKRDIGLDIGYIGPFDDD